MVWNLSELIHTVLPNAKPRDTQYGVIENISVLKCL